MYASAKERSVDPAELAAEDSFKSFFKKMPAPLQGTIRLFDRSDFYTAHGEDAIYIANHVYKTQTVIKYFGKDTPTSPAIPSCTLKISIAQTFLREALTTKQLRIEIYESEGGGKGTNKWILSKSASPGNLGEVEDLLFSKNDLVSAPVVLALKVSMTEGVKTVGVCFTDSSALQLGVSEFVDNDLFSNTEALLIQLGVKEVILASNEKTNDYDLNKIKTVVERCAIVLTEVRKSEFSTKDIDQDLNRLLATELKVNTLPEHEKQIAMASAAALISYLSLLNDINNHGKYSIYTHDLGQYMKLDASALRALNLMPDPTGMGGSNKNMSLYGLLNRCKTAQGMRLLNRWLKQPLISLPEIQRRQDLVELMIEESILRTSTQDTLKSIPDLHRISKRFQKGIANLEDIIRVYQVVLLLPGLIQLLESAGEGTSSELLIEEIWLKGMKAQNDNLQQLVEMVESTIDLEAIDRHVYNIKPDFDEGLRDISESIQEVIEGLDEEHARVAEDLGFATDGKILHFEQSGVHGYVFRLTRKESKAISGKSYSELSNKTNGVIFTSKQLKALNEQQKEHAASYEKLQKDLVKEVIKIAASYGPVLEQLNDVIAHLDVIVSFATAAINAPIPYIRPNVSEKGSGTMDLVEARHPCLEVQDGINFIPNDVNFVRDVDEFRVITGANMGGKSTFIRQVGVIALMAQIGSYVPCTSANLPVFDSILCRVGAGDSQLKGVSTFMAEMLETAAILKTATRDSLIIIDELGRGTSTYDGFGLAWAISEHIATEIRAYCLFATHFHELTSLADQILHVKNHHVMAHVEIKPDSLTGREITFLYKIQPGICDQSFGIHVAELANFPQEVIKLAKRKADDLEDFTSTPTEVTISSKFTPEAIAEGTGLVEKLLLSWANSTSSLDPTDGDIIMQGKEEKLLKELEELKMIFSGVEGEQMESNQWVKDVLTQTY